MDKKRKTRFPVEVGLGVQKISKHLKMPRLEREVVDEVRSLGFFSGFRKLKRRNQVLFGLVVSGAVILYWRGLWAFYDLFWDYTLPEHRVTAAIVSILLGVFILVGSDYAVRGLIS